MVTELRVFTHPACSGCGTAVAMAWELAEGHPGAVSLRTVSLEQEAGLREAHAAEIRTIPTIVIAVDGQERERIVGTPNAHELRQTVERILSAGA
jgi:thioredoxin-like negative regulator of GroEL